jgi:hypothetical protein
MDTASAPVLPGRPVDAESFPRAALACAAAILFPAAALAARTAGFSVISQIECLPFVTFFCLLGGSALLLAERARLATAALCGIAVACPLVACAGWLDGRTLADSGAGLAIAASGLLFTACCRVAAPPVAAGMLYISFGVLPAFLPVCMAIVRADPAARSAGEFVARCSPWTAAWRAEWRDVPPCAAAASALAGIVAILGFARSRNRADR